MQRRPPRSGHRADVGLDAAVRSLARGGLAILVPVSGRVEAPSLVAAADEIDAAMVTTMIFDGRGLLRLALHAGECARLGLRPQQGLARRRDREDMLVPIEAREGVTTGISAPDRARTLRVAAAAGTLPDDLVEPGHIAVVRAAAGGVAGRPGVAEAGLELCRLAGRREAAALCDVLDEAGAPATGAALAAIALRLAVPLCSVDEVMERGAWRADVWLPMPA